MPVSIKPSIISSIEFQIAPARDISDSFGTGTAMSTKIADLSAGLSGTSTDGQALICDAVLLYRKAPSNRYYHEYITVGIPTPYWETISQLASAKGFVTAGNPKLKFNDGCVWFEMSLPRGETILRVSEMRDGQLEEHDILDLAHFMMKVGSSAPSTARCISRSNYVTKAGASSVPWSLEITPVRIYARALSALTDAAPTP